MDDGYDLAATAEETRRQRQRELEIEAEQRVSSLLSLARMCRCQPQCILSSLNLTLQATAPLPTWPLFSCRASLCHRMLHCAIVWPDYLSSCMGSQSGRKKLQAEIPSRGKSVPACELLALRRGSGN